MKIYELAKITSDKVGSETYLDSMRYQLIKWSLETLGITLIIY